MKQLSVYRASDTMRELIRDNGLLLMVMSRFGISLGFGEGTVKEVCEKQGVHAPTFLAVANFVSQKEYDESALALAPLVEYLKQAHTYFLDYNLPAIRRRLIDAIDCSGADDVAFLILRFYDEYVTEVRRHMEYEDSTVFAYVGRLLQGLPDERYTIGTFADKHDHIEDKLKELKDIIVSYYPQKANDLLNSVLFDIINCEADLTQHRRVEDQLFIPVVRRLEEELMTRGTASPIRPQEDDEESALRLNVLSEREKEIVHCVAMGMTNKEIADALCLSINTVTTHRRNITGKLQIHTPNGLTIYALVNNLVTLDEIKM